MKIFVKMIIIRKNKNKNGGNNFSNKINIIGNIKLQINIKLRRLL